jgi:hypothetical protein
MSANRGIVGSGLTLLAAVLLGGPLSGEAAAFQKEKGKGKEPQKISDAHLVQAIEALQSVKVTLEKADHDYGGHRAAAVRDIGAAEHQLKLALAHVHKHNKIDTKTNDKSSSREPQALSDAQLAGSVPVLKASLGVIEKADHDYGGHRANAIRDLKAAIVQIEKALEFSKEKNKDKP